MNGLFRLEAGGAPDGDSVRCRQQGKRSPLRRRAVRVKADDGMLRTWNWGREIRTCRNTGFCRMSRWTGG